MTFDPTALSNTVLIITAFSAAFMAALWLSLIFWVFRDMRKRTRDPLARVLAALVPAVLFLPGVLIYLILRPQHTIEEEYQRTLEEEALLQAIEDSPLCPGCGRHIRPDWMLCPYCHARLKKSCESCSKALDLPWDICPYCGKQQAAPSGTDDGETSGAPKKTDQPLLDFLDSPGDQTPERAALSGSSLWDFQSAPGEPARKDDPLEEERNSSLGL